MWPASTQLRKFILVIRFSKYWGVKALSEKKRKHFNCLNIEQSSNIFTYLSLLQPDTAETHEANSAQGKDAQSSQQVRFEKNTLIQYNCATTYDTAI